MNMKFRDPSGRLREGDWMQTNSGVAFWPLDPAPAEIVLDDIAHALSMANRYGGHTKFPYSVAQHSVLLFDHMLEKIPENEQRPESKRDILRATIMHDAPEYVFQDFIRPVKHSIGGEYEAAYKKLEGEIAFRFDLLIYIPAEVNGADKRIVLDEQAALMSQPSPLEWSFYRGLEPLGGVRIEEWDWRRAKAEFLGRCDAVGLK